MMKIDTTNPAHRTNVVAERRTEPQPKAIETSAASDSHRTAKSRIQQWFTKIGVPADLALASGKEKSRALDNRARLRALRKIENLSAVYSLALDVAISDMTAEQIDPDWFYAFSELAENIYSSDMQELWGKILAVEVSRPGSFSLISLETLRRLTQRDAKLFASACRLASRRQGDSVPRIITDFHQRKTITRWFSTRSRVPVNLAHHGLNYPSLLALIDLGLIVANEIESAEFPLNQSIPFRCGEKKLFLQAKRNGVALAYYKFTSVGAELFKLAKRHEHSGYIEDLGRVLSPAFAIKIQK